MKNQTGTAAKHRSSKELDEEQLVTDLAIARKLWRERPEDVTASKFPARLRDPFFRVLGYWPD